VAEFWMHTRIQSRTKALQHKIDLYGVSKKNFLKYCLDMTRRGHTLKKEQNQLRWKKRVETALHEPWGLKISYIV